MKLTEEIKKDMVQSMKDRDNTKKSVLRVLMGEIQRDFVTEDDDVIKKVKKMVSNLKETNGDQVEIEILESYLPKQLTRDELIGHARVFIETNKLSGPREMGKVMGYFNKNFTGLYDGKKLSNIVKSLLS